MSGSKECSINKDDMKFKLAEMFNKTVIHTDKLFN